MTRQAILVTGATGNVGSAVVRGLLAADRSVRATGRTTESVKQMFGERVDAVTLNFTDASTWPGAFAGVRQMFLLRPPQLGRPKQQIIPALEYAYAHGVQQIVFLSLQGAERNKVVPHAAIENWLETSGASWTFIRASFFHQNLTTTHLTDIRDRDELMVPAGDGATAFIDSEDVGAVACLALLEPSRYADQALTVTGAKALTYHQVAQKLSAQLGRTIRYARPGLIRYAVHARRVLKMPWGMVVITAAIYTSTRLGLAAGITATVRNLLEREPISFEQFAQRERARWIHEKSPVEGKGNPE